MKMYDLVQFLKKYKELSSDEIMKMRYEVFAAWNVLIEEFNNLCLDDPEIEAARVEVEKVREIIGFDTEEEFATYAYTANEGLGDDLEEPVYEFNRKEYKKIMTMVKNFDVEEKKLLEKLNRVKASNALFKEQKIAHLEDSLKVIRHIKRDYGVAVAKEQEKLKYLDNAATLVTPVEEKYKKLLLAKAKEYMTKKIEKNPALITLETYHFPYDSTRAIYQVVKEVRSMVEVLAKSNKRG